MERLGAAPATPAQTKEDSVRTVLAQFRQLLEAPTWFVRPSDQGPHPEGGQRTLGFASGWITR
jgi:hypothetical protein